MSSLLAIDSGHPECAVAGAIDRTLRYVGHASLQSVPAWLFEVSDFSDCDVWDSAVVEIPTVRGEATPNPEDLLLIAVAGARLAQRFVASLADVREYRPAEWKGNTPKPPHHARMWGALSVSEKRLLGGEKTARAIGAACGRGAADRWRKPGARYYRASEFPTVNGVKITHDILDASALALYDLGRIKKG